MSKKNIIKDDGEWSKQELTAFLESSAREFTRLLTLDDKGFFAKGRFLCSMYDKAVAGGKRVSNGDDIFIAFTRILRKVAPTRAVGTSSLRNYVNAYRTWRDLGGEKGKAPDVPFSMYERVSRSDIDLEQRHELLNKALHLRWNCDDLSRYIQNKYGRPRQSSESDDDDSLNLEIATAFTNITGLLNEIRSAGKSVDKSTVEWMRALANALTICADELSEKSKADAA